MNTHALSSLPGWRIYGLGVMALGVVCLVLGEFSPGQPVPAGLPGRTGLAYAAAACMFIAGAATAWRRTVVYGAAALAAYFALVVGVLMHGRLLLIQPTPFMTCESLAVQLALAAGGLLVCADHAGIDPRLAAWLARVGQVAFGLCALVFGTAHFVYMDLTVPLVPAWLPPSQTFWAGATGLGHIAAGVAIVARRQARLAAILLTAMFATFTLLVHVPMLLADPASHWFWTENATNLALVGAAWALVDSLAPWWLPADLRIAARRA